MKSSITILLLNLLIVNGCAHDYQVPDKKNTAVLHIKVSSDSVGVTGRFIKIMTYSQTDCAPGDYGSNLDDSSFTDKNTTFKPIKIVANEPFLLSVRYSESRRTENRACSADIKFFPRAKHDYIAAMKISSDVSRCAINVQDLKDDTYKLKYSLPKKSCIGNKSINGQAKQSRYIINYSTY